MNWGKPNKLEYALRVAGALGYITLAGLDRITISTLCNSNTKDSILGYFPPHRGKQSSPALFDFLETYLPASSRNPFPPPSPSSLVSALNRYAAQARHPGPLFILSDLFEPRPQSKGMLDFQNPLNTLSAKGFEITLLNTLAPEEINPNLSGDLKLLDCESGDEVEITADFDLLERYRNSLTAWQADLRRFCRARGMNYLPVETTLPLEELIFSWMRQYEIIR
jgi:hypothetical protein